MQKLTEKLVYIILSAVIFIILFKFFAWLQNAYLPIHYKMDLISLIIIMPIIAITALITPHFVLKSMKGTAN